MLDIFHTIPRYKGHIGTGRLSVQKNKKPEKNTSTAISLELGNVHTNTSMYI